MTQLNTPVELQGAQAVKRPAKPEPAPVNLEAIPGPLKDRPQWVCWRYEWDAKRSEWAKVPRRTDGHGKASSTDPATWSPFATAADAYQRGGYAGIGFVLSQDDPFTAVDLDKCLGESWAVDMLDGFDSYTEVSPSGNGYRVFIEATKPEGMRCKSKDLHASKVEVYDKGRFMTVTGHRVDGTPAEIRQRAEALATECTALLKKPSPPKASSTRQVANLPADDAELLRALERIKPQAFALYHGQVKSDDASGNDQSLCNELAWLTGSDAARMDRLFRGSALMRPKWDERHRGDGATYGQMTIETAIRDTRSAYDPNYQTNAPAGVDPAVLKEEARQNFLDTFKEPDKAPLPAVPQDLLALPYGLGEIQAFVFGTMSYPSPAAAGITALAVMAAFAQRDIVIDSQDGLGLNEQYMLIGGTGTGKDAPRRAFRAILKAVSSSHKDDLTKALDMPRTGGDMGAAVSAAPSLVSSLPASPQALHKLLEEDRARFILSDEHGKRWASLEQNYHARQLEEYLKEAFSSALYSINPGVSKTDMYQDVENPRVSILATSTPGHISSAMEAANGESGVYNRWVILPLEDGEERPQKRYTGLKFDVPNDVVDLLKWVQRLGETRITFNGEAFKAYMELDQRITEPLKIRDNVLAGRLAEHAIKMAGLIALSDRRTAIASDDLRASFSIMEGVYHRMKATLGEHEAMDDSPEHVKAMEGIKRFLTTKETFTKGGAFNCCRPAKRLTAQQKEGIFRELLAEGFVEQIPGTRGRYRSNVYGLHIEPA